MKHLSYAEVANPGRGSIGRSVLDKRKIIIETISGLLILLFLYTGLSKLFDHELFISQLTLSPLLPPIAGIISYSLPVFEIIIAMLLLIRKWQLTGLYISFALLSLFSIYLIIMVSFYKDLPCTCGGIISKMSWGQHIAFNIVFAFLTYLAIYLSKKGNTRNS